MLQLLPLGATHLSAAEMIGTLMPKRAAHQGNKALREALGVPPQGVMVEGEDGALRERIPVLIDAAMLQDWLGIVARGLAAFHWGIVVPRYQLHVAPLTAAQEKTMVETLVSGSGCDQVERTIGDAVFRYRGFRYPENPDATAWLIEPYGRMPFGGDPSFSQVVASCWSVFVTEPD